MKKRISQRDIAHLLGINVSTVSRALKGLPGVSTVLREKIISLAEKKDYRPNPFAMSLRYDTTHTIGIVVPDMSFNHFAHIVKWIEAEARKKGYMCIITDSGDNSHDEKELPCVFPRILPISRISSVYGIVIYLLFFSTGWLM